MKITIERTAIAAALAAEDVAAEEIDARQGYSKPFQGVADLTRLGLNLGAVAVNLANIEVNYSDLVFYVTLNPLAKSLYRGAVTAMGKLTTVRGGPSSKSVTVRAAPSSGLQPVVQPLGNFRSITA